MTLTFRSQPFAWGCPVPIEAHLFDGNIEPVAGVPVAFGLYYAEGGAVLSGDAGVTDEYGRTSVLFIPAPADGFLAVTAQAPGLTVQVYGGVLAAEEGQRPCGHVEAGTGATGWIWLNVFAVMLFVAWRTVSHRIISET